MGYNHAAKFDKEKRRRIGTDEDGVINNLESYYKD